MYGRYQTFIDSLIRWGEANDNLLCGILVGSQARTDHVADDYSDLDIILIVDNPDLLLSNDQWLDSIDNYKISFIEKSISGTMERRVLFDNALDVDFIMLPSSKISTLNNGDAAAILERGYCILIDKVSIKDLISLPKRVPSHFPTEEEFINIVNDFWYHSVWTVKKLKRGEIWTAKSCLDNYMKQLLLSVIEYHSRTIHGIDYYTWYNGRFIEEWAETWIIDKLTSCFSLYSEVSVKTALLSTMDLFRLIAVTIAGRQKYSYPYMADEYATTWVVEALDV